MTRRDGVQVSASTVMRAVSAYDLVCRCAYGLMCRSVLGGS